MNKDIEKRDKILFGSYNPDDYMGGIKRFDNVTVETLNKLIDEEFLDGDGTQNYSPTVDEFIEFMDEYPNWTAFGYAVSNHRGDYRITVTGIERNEGMTQIDKELEDFVDLARHAEEFDIKGYCWWD
jgi:hypothetical protein